MGIPRLSIESSNASLRIRSHAPELRIKSRPAQLEISQAQPAPRLDYSAGSIEIDYTKARASEGYFGPTALADHISQYTDKLRAEGIARIVDKGDYLADVAHHPHGVAAWSAMRMVAEGRDLQFGIGFLPKSPPEITITPSNLHSTLGYRRPDIQFQSERPMIEIRTQQNEISVIPPSLRIFVEGSGS